MPKGGQDPPARMGLGVARWHPHGAGQGPEVTRGPRSIPAAALRCLGTPGECSPSPGVPPACLPALPAASTAACTRPALFSREVRGQQHL